MANDEKMLTFLENDEVVDNMPLPSGWKDDQVIDLDAFLRKCGILKENQEIAITSLIPE